MTVTHAASSPAPSLPFLGNLKVLYWHRKTIVQGLMEAWRDHGSIFQLQTPFGAPIILCDHALVSEVLDERRFEKGVGRPLEKVRSFAGDGLFTAYNHEPNWETAHNILVPAFGMRSIREYYPAMLDKAEELASSWSSRGAGAEVDVSADMTRLTFDTIGLCGFGQDFGSFGRTEPHPFVEAMNASLASAMHNLNRPDALEPLFFAQECRARAMRELMEASVDEVIAERRRSGERRPDLLDLMLYGEDPKTGRRLDDVNIRRQVITFLVAGHETTSGLLSFALYFLLKDPEVMAKARREVDGVIGGEQPSFEDIGRLRYLKQILMESLRLWPTAPAFTRVPRQDLILGGKTFVPKGQELVVLINALHRDPEVWGPDVDSFDPERFSPEASRHRPASAFRPFGTGKRACIGRQFAMVEATLALAVILQRFELVDHTRYELKVAETLTLKPEGFHLQVHPRRERPVGRSERPIGLAEAPSAPSRCPFHH